MAESEEYRVYWQPGCSSCLAAKEFLRAHRIPFASINVRAQAGLDLGSQYCADLFDRLDDVIAGRRDDVVRRLTAEDWIRE